MTTPERRASGVLEAQVMAAVWDLDGWASPRQVLDRLPPDPPVVYSTVKTVLERLCRKGALLRRPEGKGFAYRAVQNRDERAAERMVAMLDTAQDTDTALAHFLAGLDSQRRRQLRRLLAGRGR